MKIALMTDGIFPYVVGGMQRHSFYLAKYLAAEGHQVDLYHTNQSKLDIAKLDVFSAEEKKNIRSFVVPFPKFEKVPGHYIRESFEYSKQLWTIFSKQPPVDFIYAKGFSGWALLDKKRHGAKLPPVGVNFHGYEMFQQAPSFTEWLKYAFMLRSPVKFCVRHADYLFSYGGKITSLIESLGVNRDRIIEIPAGIEPSWLVNKPGANNDVRRFVFVGRYERRKGLPELNEQLKTFDRSAKMEFTFVGDIPNSKRVAGDRFHYYGKITETNKLQEILRGSDVLVCPSFSEGMPNVILEAMASGLAVIATDVGAVSVAVNNKNGWLIEPANGQALKEAILDACRISPEDLQAKKQSALDDVRTKFQWPQIIGKTVRSIEKAIISGR